MNNIYTLTKNNKSLSIEFLSNNTLRIFDKKVKTDLIELCYKVNKTVPEINNDEFIYQGYHVVLKDNFDLVIYKNNVLVVSISNEYKEDQMNVHYALSDVSSVYGLGDKMAAMNRKGYYFRQWNTDDPVHQDELYPSLYKSINFLLNYTNKNYFGLFFPSTYPYEFDISHKALNHVYINSKCTSIDYFLFLGDKPKDIISNYSSLVGHPYFIRMKMLGNQQSRWSYNNEKEVRDVMEGYLKAKIPLDYIHFDIDYMDGFRDFTVDTNKFPDMKGLNKYLNSHHVEGVVINDSGVKVDENYVFYKFCKDKNLFSTYQGKEYVGTVWPGDAVFPKYYSKDAKKYFSEICYSFMKENGFTGLWNDMNEPTSFKGELPLDVDFSIKGRELTHLEEHNVYGEHMIRCFNSIWEKDNIRPYIFTRSAFATTPKYAFVWNGDNFSLWHHLRLCIPQILTMSISGAMFNGADVGGFGSDSTKELVIRWAEANVLMPFFRNHSNLNSKAQEPYAYDKELEDIYRHYIKIRYELIPYLYTLTYHMNKDGEPIVRPLFYNYPEDKNVLEINDQYMVGENMMVAPVVDQGVKERIVYFPKGIWFDYETGEKYTGGRSYIISMPLEKTGIFVKNHCIIPVFSNLMYIDRKEIDTIGFKVFGNSGSCELYDDDGISLDYKKKVFNVYKVSYKNSEFTLKSIKNGYESPYRNIKLYTNNKCYDLIFNSDIKEMIKND